MMGEGAGEATVRRWQPGDVAVLRYITRTDARPGATWPCRLVDDRDDLLALYIAQGTTFKEWQPSPGAPDRRLEDTHWRGDVLRLMFPGRWHSIWLFWRSDEQRSFRGYYVNFEEPFRRSAIGFDTNDHALDLLVAPDLTWSWKDVDDFEDRVRRGLYSAPFAAAVRAEAQRGIAAIESRASPFCDGWEEWRPDPVWEVPRLPPTWETAPVAQWERRAWAYPGAR